MKISTLFFFFIFTSNYFFASNKFVDSIQFEIKKLEGQKKSKSQQEKLIELHLYSAWELKHSLSDSAIYHCQKSIQIIHKNYHSKTLTFFPVMEKKMKQNDNSNLPILMYKTQNVLGVIFDLKGNYSKSLEHYFYALKILNILEIHGKEREKLYNYKSNILGNLAIVYEELGEYDKALSYNEKTLVLYKKTKNVSGEAISLGNIGIIYYSLKKYENAKTYFEKAIALFEEIEDESSLSKNISNLALIYFEQKKFQKALSLFQKGLAIDQKNGEQIGIASKLGNIALIYIEQKNYKEAEKNLIQALKISKKLDASYLLKDHNFYLSELYEATNKHDLALHHYKISVAYSDSLKNYDEIKSQTLLEANFSFDKIQYAQKLKREKEGLVNKLKIKNQQISIFLISIVCILIIVAGFFIFKNLQKSKRQIQFEAEKRRLEIEIKLLQTQMNPHFIFNSLNSIYNYINEKNNDAAAKLLLDLSKLIRKILEHSTKEFISLEDEIEQLKLYISIEQSRFSNSFSFEFIIDDSINLDELEVPGMLIQPFIENAIIHGLAPLKNNSGSLNVNFQLSSDEKLIVQIQDNGVGRLPKEIHHEKKNHESLSIKLIQERLNLLNKSTVNSVEISDLPQGTRVKLSIPVNYTF